MKDPRARLIVALDVPDRSSALKAVDRLAGHVGCFKLGMEIFISEGPPLIKEIRERGERVFLDLKLHDIPNTVGSAVRAACRLGVQMLTLHAAGGRAMLEAGCAAAESCAAPPVLLAVTALTSLSETEARRIGIDEPLAAWVDRLASMAADTGVPGLVVSPWEVARLRQKFGQQLRLVVPGIRPAGVPSQDQSRTAQPAEAIRAGADFLVIGRPILQASDPAAAADQITREIETALNQERPAKKP